jgi:uncharacterized protein YrrD
MLITASHMKDFSIHAADGDIGRIEDFYFDDEKWTVRYLVVQTGTWLFGRSVLISPVFLSHVDWENKRLHLSLTKKQIQDSPEVNTHRPVSRQHEAEYMMYYGAPYYWGGSDVWGSGPIPAGLVGPILPSPMQTQRDNQDLADSYLRSTAALTGYHVSAADGAMGHVDDFMLDADTWTIRYLEINTSYWWVGKKVLMSPEWIESISWLDTNISINLLRETIKTAPEYIESRLITRAYELRLHEHYGQLPYCLWEAKHDVPPHVLV